MSGFWSHNRSTLGFLCKDFGCKTANNYSSQRIGIRQHIIITLVTHQLKHGHKLINGFTIDNTLVALLRVQIKLTGDWINDAACQVIVLHGVLCLLAYYSAIRTRCQDRVSVVDRTIPSLPLIMTLKVVSSTYSKVTSFSFVGIETSPTVNSILPSTSSLCAGDTVPNPTL